MRNWLAIAVVGAALATTSLWAQMRGAHSGGARPSFGHGPVVGQHSAFTPHSAARLSSMPINHSQFVGHNFHSPFFDGRGSNFHHHHHHHHHQFFITSFGWPYGYNNYLGYYPWSSPFFGDSYNDPNNDYADQNSQLQRQLNELNNEVQRLRDEHTARSLPPTPQQASPQPQNNDPPPATTVVFRDGRTQKVSNYAIADGTLWVFNKQQATKIPLSELDVPATQKANEEQGMSFHVPPAS